MIEVPGLAQNSNLGMVIKQQRAAVSLTLQKLADMAGVSASHIGRIENGERFPSARVLCKISGPLCIPENELFTLAGYLPQPAHVVVPPKEHKGLDPYVASVLSQEPVEVQRAVTDVLAILKNIAVNVPEQNKNI